MANDLPLIGASKANELQSTKKMSNDRRTVGAEIDALKSDHDSYHTNYSNDVLTPIRSDSTLLIRFPILIGSSIERIEKAINDASPKSKEILDRMKEKLSPENYEKAIKFIQESMNQYNGQKILMVDDTLASRDPLFNLAARLNQSRDSIFTDSVDKNLEIFSKFLQLQRSKGVAFSFQYDNLSCQSDKGLKVLENMMDGLKKNDIEIKGSHMQALLYLTHYLKDDATKRYSGFSSEEVDRMTISLLENMQPKILDEIVFLEKVKPGLGETIKDITVSYIENNGVVGALGIKDFFKDINRYVDGLSIQGETDIEDSLHSLSRLLKKINLNDGIVENLLKAHFHGGIARSARLLHFLEESPQETFESVLKNIVSTFEDGIKSSDKVAVVSMAGVNDDTTSEYGFDVLGVRFGKVLKDLDKADYKILAFEVDQDKQILSSIIRGKRITKRAPDIFVLAGHGSIGENGTEDSRATILGKSRQESQFKPVNPDFIQEARVRNPDLVERLGTKVPLPKWHIEGVGNSEVTFDAAALDKDDKDIMQNMGLLFGGLTDVVLFSCSIGKQGDTSLAQMLANEIGCNTFASHERIQDAFLNFVRGKLNDVRYENFGIKVSSEKFIPQEQ